MASEWIFVVIIMALLLMVAWLVVKDIEQKQEPVIIEQPYPYVLPMRKHWRRRRRWHP